MGKITPKFSPWTQSEKPGAWQLLNITRNTAIDRTRSLRFINDTRTYGLDNNAALDKCFTIQPQVEDIGTKDGLAKLTVEHQQLVDYIYWQGYTHVETAQALHIPIGTVKSRIRSAIRQFKICFFKSL